MPPVITDLAQSKKFIFVLCISILIVVSAFFHVVTKTEALSLLGVLWPVYLGAQGIADVSQKLADAHERVQDQRQTLISEDKVQLMDTVKTMFPALLEGLMSVSKPGFMYASGPIEVPTLFKKGQRVIHLGLGPDDIGVVREDQKSHADAVKVIFASNAEDVDSCDPMNLLKVPADYVGPKATKSTSAQDAS